MELKSRQCGISFMDIYMIDNAEKALRTTFPVGSSYGGTQNIGQFGFLSKAEDTNQFGSNLV